MNGHNLYCDICNKLLDYDGHRGNKPHKCSEGSRCFTRKSDLKAHFEIHNPECKKIHVCDFCGKDFYRVHELNRHSLLHAENKTYVCGVCNKGFPTAHGLKSHCMLHTGIKSFTCDKCRKSFAQKSTLSLHLIQHAGVKDHECARCGMRFARTFYLESHIRTHTKEKPYSCETCGVCLSSRYSLQCHKLVHSGKKKTYVCHVFDQTFTWKSTCKKHMDNYEKCSRNHENLL